MLFGTQSLPHKIKYNEYVSMMTGVHFTRRSTKQMLFGTGASLPKEAAQ